MLEKRVSLLNINFDENRWRNLKLLIPDWKQTEGSIEEMEEVEMELSKMKNGEALELFTYQLKLRNYAV